MKTHRTGLAVALAALVSLLVPPVAGAAVWQGPAAISDASLQAFDNPHVALGAAGDAAAGWWDSGDGGRVVIARKRAGAAWSAPVKLGAGPDSVTVYVGVDGAGNVTATWSTGNGGPLDPSVTSIATWLATSAAPTVEVLNTALLDVPEPVYVNDLAVSPAGQAVLAGLAGDYDMVLGYRASPTGAWAYNQKRGVQGSQPLQDPHVAINDTGNAVASYHTSSTIWASRRNAFADWGPVETVAAAGSAESRSVAIDSSGNTYVAFAISVATDSVSAGAAFRPVGGDWALAFPLSPNTAPFVASHVTVAMNRSGAAFLTWTQTGPAPADSGINGKAGTNGVWSATTERVSEMGADYAHTVVGDDGTVLSVWQRDPGDDPRTSFARMRTPAGVWGENHPLSAAYSGYADPNPATDGRQYAVVTAPLIGATKQVLVGIFDPVPPVITSAAFTGTAEAGDPLGFTVAATDELSAIPTVTWTFGDGASGTGAAVSHAYENAGTYTASVTVVDAAGNATARQVPVTVAAQQSTLTAATLSGQWKLSQIKGTLVVKGTAPRAGTYVVDVLKGKTRKIHASLKLPAGAFNRSIKLPAKLVPGSYQVSLLPSFPATQVKPAGRTAKLAAPATGVVDVSVLSGVKNGPSAGSLRNVDTIWASFHFAAVPKGKLKLTWYITPKGKKRVSLGAATKSPAAKVVSFIKLNGRRGKITAVISRNGVPVAQRSVTAK